MTNSLNNRELVLDMLNEVTENKAFSHVVLNKTLSKYQYLDKQERSFITKVTQGTVENMIQLDYIIDLFSKVPVKKMKPLIRNLLRMSVYEIKYMDSIPNSATCNEAVKLAVKRGFSGLKGFVNGVLRNIARNIDEISYPNPSEDLVEYMKIKYSMPEWLVEQLFVQYGVEDASRIIEGFSRRYSYLTVRCNMKAGVEDVIKSLESQKITVKRNALYEYALDIKDYDYLEKVEAFNGGLINVQDVSSMMVAYIAEPEKDDICLDLCAAPGGKAIHIAELLNGSGRVVARDISESKLNLIEENIERTSLENIVTECADATAFDEKMQEKADIVIADLPCSGLGVIGKKSDIKYNMTEEKEYEIIQLQRKILSNAWKYLKPGGTMIYSTCTINKNENIENLNWLLKEFPLETVDISKYFPENFKCSTLKKGYAQMLPGINDTDGFFISKLVRKV